MDKREASVNERAVADVSSAIPIVSVVTSLPASRRDAEFAISDLLMRNIEIYGGDRAVIYGEHVQSWAQLGENALRLADAMTADGIGRGDRIAALQGNAPELVEIAYAAALLGVVLVPVSPRLVLDEVAFVVRDAQVKRAFVEVGHPATRAFDGVPIVETRSAGYAVYRDAGDPVEPAALGRADDVVLQLYTSGTTGRPKGALLTQRAMVQNGLTIQLSQQLTHNDVFLSATPLTHAAAGTRVFSLGIDGISLVILDRFTPDSFFDAVARHGVTTTILVPTMLRDVLESPSLELADLHTLRFIVYGAAPTPEALIRLALERLPCGLVQGYGLTEGSPALTIITPEEHVRFAADPKLSHLLGSIGRPVPSVRFRVVGADGKPVAAGETGEMEVRSTKSMVGYWNDPEKTTSAFSDGWLRTGDIGNQDEQGYIFLLDRKNDMLISGGLNIYPSEIERVLLSDPSVREAAVVGQPHERWGEVPAAFVVPTDAHGTDHVVTLQDALRALCRARLADYKQPVAIIIIDALPRNETGKVQKDVLRELVSTPITSGLA
jgi:acyl-CoA synthetase (AMP-forming)/AMP-acid ligase II